MGLIWQNIVIESLTVAVEIILVIRGAPHSPRLLPVQCSLHALIDQVYALYNRNRIVLALLLCLMAAEVGAMCGVLALTVPRFRMSARCLVVATPQLFPFFWYSNVTMVCVCCRVY